MPSPPESSSPGPVKVRGASKSVETAEKQRSNIYSPRRLRSYWLRDHILPSKCRICLIRQREPEIRKAALRRSAKKAMTTAFKNAEAMTEAALNAEEAEKIAATRTEEARLKAEEQEASVKAVKGAEEATEAAHKAEEE